MRVLVTGGAGFIGSHVVYALLNRGDGVAVLDDLSSGRAENVPSHVPLYREDVRSRGGLREAFARFRPTHVCHLAAQASVKRSVEAPLDDAAVNVLGGINVLEAARDARVRRVVLASTGGAIYGEVPAARRAEESWPLQPKSPYAAAKAALEHYASVYSQSFGLETSVLRFANVFGPRQDPSGEAGVVAIFMAKLLQGERLGLFARRVAGDAGCVRDYVFVSDVVRANLMALDGRIAGTFNVASGQGLTTRAVAAALGQALGIDPVIDALPPRPGDLERSVLDPTALEQTGWRAEVSFERGVELTARWFACMQNAA